MPPGLVVVVVSASAGSPLFVVATDLGTSSALSAHNHHPPLQNRNRKIYTTMYLHPESRLSEKQSTVFTSFKLF